jgi:hypothetical protein
MTPDSEHKRIPQSVCIECGVHLDTVSSLDHTVARPKPGDPIACLECGAVMTMENDKIRPFTIEEADSLLADKAAVIHLLQVVKRIHFAHYVYDRRN